MTQNPKNRFKKGLIISLYTLLAFLAIATIVGLWGLKPLLSKRIQYAVLKSTDSLYHIDFKDIQYNITGGDARILGVRWQADTTLYKQLDLAKKMPDNIYQAQVDEIHLTGINPWKIIFSSKLHLQSISIKEPVIQINHHRQYYNSFKTITPFYTILSKFVKSFSVEKVSLDNINFTFINHSEKKTPSTSKVEHLDIELTDLLIDSTSHRDKSRFYYMKECVFKLDKLEILTEDSLNKFKIKELLFSTKSKSLSLEHLEYEPQYKEIAYGNKTDGDDRISIICKNIKLDSIDLHKLFEEKKIYAKNLGINNGQINVFTDTRLFKPHKKMDYRPFPHEAFRKWQLKFLIDTIKLSRFKITYSEYNPQTNLVGNVIFDKANGYVHNFTNDSVPLAKNPNCMVFLKSKLINKANVHFSFRFNIADKQGDFSCNGKVFNMQIATVNQVTEALVMAKAQEGYLSYFAFDMHGNKFGLKGSTTMLYQDLNVMIYKFPPEDGVFKKRKLLSFIANTFVIKKSNPTGKKPPRVAIINYQRIPDKPFFYTLWKGLLEGIKGSVL
ncbi:MULTISPECIES: hypothetical protein [unclassified Arcicella]|uniref:hypothetical protein n=1 Tax=unclassified Arcicella TaxID=2644986 RepID=UPI00285B9210|nr:MULTISPECIES: hypothetical protein [unclassified Arcicella]MDR6563034.1 hypothetical protein [Arcicella sp. BE51]MDR6813118.1 hypothetical protein [Arcicella sp. BE140]MDR6824432.1 hypothetical protein [Arcicella sp. BE139]